MIRGSAFAVRAALVVGAAFVAGSAATGGMLGASAAVDVFRLAMSAARRPSITAAASRGFRADLIQGRWVVFSMEGK
jgi:hypothetical protein